ncbi:hypothetical protein [Streptomyces buecherae]|uniref:hypothetical protein n=1 Tax=Streptomyces buecherae TaxID=2763006 RepID=UPI0036A2CC69
MDTTDTTDTKELHADLDDAWERFRAAAARIAELQAAMWSDAVSLGAGLLTGRPPWNRASSAYYAFVSEEGARFAREQAELGIDYARNMAETTREYERRLMERMDLVVEPLPNGGSDAEEPGTRAKGRKGGAGKTPREPEAQR